MILYILVSDGGDGSYYPRFILDKSVLDEIETLVDSDVWDYENGQSGRTQSEEESDEIGKKIRTMLEHECCLDTNLIYVDSDVKPKKLWKIIQEN